MAYRKLFEGGGGKPTELIKYIIKVQYNTNSYTLNLSGWIRHLK